MTRAIVLHRRTDVQGAKPLSTDIETGEIGLNYMKGSERMFIKNTVNEVVEFAPKDYTDNIIYGLTNELSEKQDTLISGSNMLIIRHHKELVGFKQKVIMVFSSTYPIQNTIR